MNIFGIQAQNVINFKMRTLQQFRPNVLGDLGLDSNVLKSQIRTFKNLSMPQMFLKIKNNFKGVTL